MRNSRASRILAILASAAALVITIRIWITVSAYQGIWPMPGLYFLEMIWLPMIGISLTTLETRAAILGLWAISGAILGFIVMGALSVGPAYIPILILMAGSAVLSPHTQVRDHLIGLAVALLAGVLQGVFMLAAIQVMLR